MLLARFALEPLSAARAAVSGSIKKRDKSSAASHLPSWCACIPPGVRVDKRCKDRPAASIS